MKFKSHINLQINVHVYNKCGTGGIVIIHNNNNRDNLLMSCTHCCACVPVSEMCSVLPLVPGGAVDIPLGGSSALCCPDEFTVDSVVFCDTVTLLVF